MLAQLQTQVSYLQAALVFSLLVNAVAIGAAAVAISQAWRERADRLIAPALRTLSR